MSYTKLTYEPDIFDYPIDCIGKWHCIAVHFDREALVWQRSIMVDFLKQASSLLGFSHMDLGVSQADVTITLCIRRYGAWLNDNAGVDGVDWVVDFSQLSEMDVGAIRFASKDKAMLFKLTFDNQ